MTDVPVSQEARELLAWVPGFDDRTEVLLSAEASRRDALHWDEEDAQNVIAFLLSQIDAHHRQQAERAFEDRERKLREESRLLREALDADCTAFAAMEEKLIEVANRISGIAGGPPCHPDPVMLSEWVSEINQASLSALQPDPRLVALEDRAWASILKETPDAQ